MDYQTQKRILTDDIIRADIAAAKPKKGIHIAHIVSWIIMLLILIFTTWVAWYLLPIWIILMIRAAKHIFNYKLFDKPDYMVVDRRVIKKQTYLSSRFLNFNLFGDNKFQRIAVNDTVYASTEVGDEFYVVVLKKYKPIQKIHPTIMYSKKEWVLPQQNITQ